MRYVDLCMTGRPAPSRGTFVECGSRTTDLGDLFYIPAGLSLDTSGSAGWQRGVRLYCSKKDFSTALNADFTHEAPSRWLSIDSSAVRRNLVLLCREVLCPRFASDVMVYGLCMTAMAELALFGSTAASEVRTGGLSPWRMRLLDERLNEPGPPPTVRELAELCRLSERHLLRAFKEETGDKLGNHVAFHAIDRARKRLSQTDWKIQRIAHEAGFKSASSFSAAFRSRLGVSPSVYRAEFR